MYFFGRYTKCCNQLRFVESLFYLPTDRPCDMDYCPVNLGNVRALRAAGKFVLAVDYAAVARFVVRFVASHRPRLLETLGEALAQRLLEAFDTPWVRLRLTKPRAVPGARWEARSVSRVRS